MIYLPVLVCHWFILQIFFIKITKLKIKINEIPHTKQKKNERSKKKNKNEKKRLVSFHCKH